jgi:hypothetical protein
MWELLPHASRENQYPACQQFLSIQIRRNAIMSEEIKKIDRKPYSPPEIIHELELETRAGSPLGLPDPLDLTGG